MPSKFQTTFKFCFFSPFLLAIISCHGKLSASLQSLKRHDIKIFFFSKARKIVKLLRRSEKAGRWKALKETFVINFARENATRWWNIIVVADRKGLIRLFYVMNSPRSFHSSYERRNDKEIKHHWDVSLSWCKNHRKSALFHSQACSFYDSVVELLCRVISDCSNLETCENAWVALLCWKEFKFFLLLRLLLSGHSSQGDDVERHVNNYFNSKCNKRI